MSTEYKIGFAVGLAATLLFFAVVIALLRRRTGHKGGMCPGGYDERQQLARGKALKYAYITVVVYLVFLAVVNSTFETPWFDAITGPFLGICLSATVFFVSCVMNDAYISLKEKPAFIIGLFSVVALLNAAVSVVNIAAGERFVTDGALNFHAMNMIVFVMFAVLLITLFIKRAKDKREDE